MSAEVHESAGIWARALMSDAESDTEPDTRFFLLFLLFYLGARIRDASVCQPL